MDRKNNHTCQMCGNEYYHCNDCDTVHSWRVCCDTPECWQVYMIIYEYRDGRISKEEAALMFGRIGFKSYHEELIRGKFIPSIADTIIGIIKTPAIKPQTTKGKGKIISGCVPDEIEGAVCGD